LADPEHLGQTHVVPAQDGMVNVVTDIDRDSLYTKIELTLRKDLLR
jgi:hypothetical protein